MCNSLKENKIHTINLTKELKDLCIDLKPLKKEVEKDTRKWKVSVLLDPQN